MTKYTRKYAAWLKCASVSLIFLFLVNTLSFATPDISFYELRDTLQVQSLFSPILDEVGQQNFGFVRISLRLIKAMSLRGLAKKGVPAYKSRLNINSALDAQSVFRGENGKLFEVTENPVRLPDGSVKVTARITGFGEEERVFEIIFTDDGSPRKLDPANTSITKRPPDTENVPGNKKAPEPSPAGEKILPEVHNLWVHPKVLKMAKELKINGLKNFKEIDMPLVLSNAQIGKLSDNRVVGIYEYENGVQVIKKRISQIETIKEFLEPQNPFCCPSFFVDGDNEYIYELNLLQFGYRSLGETGPLSKMNHTDKFRDIIRKALLNIFKNDNRGFIHGHLHRHNILAKRDAEGNIVDVKIIDWKYVRKMSPENSGSISGGYSYGRRKDALLGKKMSGSRRVELLTIEKKDLSSSKLKHILFHWINLTETSLKNSKLRFISFFLSDLDNSDLHGTTAHSIYMSESSLRNTNFELSRITGRFSIRNWLYDIFYIVKKDVRNLFSPEWFKPSFWLFSGFRECDLSRSTFKGSKLNHVKFIDCFMEHIDFRNTKIAKSFFHYCDLTGADFRGIKGIKWGDKDHREYALDIRVQDINRGEFEPLAKNRNRWINIFYHSKLERTLFDRDKGKYFEKEGYIVEYPRNADWCEVTSPPGNNPAAKREFPKDINDFERPIRLIELTPIENLSKPTPAGSGTTAHAPVKPEKAIPLQRHNGSLSLLSRSSNALAGYPVNMTIDLSLIPNTKKEIDANMRTWAYLILLHRQKGLNVNYIFLEEKGVVYEKDPVDTLFNHIRHIDKHGTVNMDEILRRVNNRNTDPRAIDVHIMKLEDLRAMRSLPENFFPVAMSEGETTEGYPLRDFAAAATIGLAQAACEKVKRENRAGLREFISRDILPRLHEIYERLFPDEKIEDLITTETISNMISNNPVVRKNLAITLALPPIIRADIEQLKAYHDRVHVLLRSA